MDEKCNWQLRISTVFFMLSSLWMAGNALAEEPNLNKLHKQSIAAYRNGDLLKAETLSKQSLEGVVLTKPMAPSYLCSLAVLLLVYHSTNRFNDETKTLTQLLLLLPNQSSSFDETLLALLREYQILIAKSATYGNSYRVASSIPQLAIPEGTLESTAAGPDEKVLELSSYRKACLTMIASRWKPEDGDEKIVLSLIIESTGKAKKAFLLKGSGNSTLDSRAIRLVETIVYPTVPSSQAVTGVHFIVHFGGEYPGSIRSISEQMKSEKKLGP